MLMQPGPRPGRLPARAERQPPREQFELAVARLTVLPRRLHGLFEQQREELREGYAAIDSQMSRLTREAAGRDMVTLFCAIVAILLSVRIQRNTDSAQGPAVADRASRSRRTFLDSRVPAR